MVEDPKLHRHSVWLNECECKVTSIKRLETTSPGPHLLLFHGLSEVLQPNIVGKRKT